jgi:tRNA(Arg) A34 adenosine deaminase TadA
MKFGAVVVQLGDWEGAEVVEILAKEYSTTVENNDPTQHAELKAVGSACRAVGNDRYVLKQCLLYTTCEPCVMCAGAILWGRLGGVVWGMSRTDAPHCFDYSTDWHRPLGSISKMFPYYQQGGILAKECVRLLMPPKPQV